MNEISTNEELENYIQPVADDKGNLSEAPWQDEVDILGSSNIGPIKVEYIIKGTTVQVVIYLLNLRVASATLSAGGKTSICIKAGAVLVKAEICIVADFDKNELRAKGQHCYKKLDTSWQCTKFSKRIAGW